MDYPDSGHFDCWIRHIGGSTVLHYDDMDPMIEPLFQRSQTMFYEGNFRAKRGPCYAVYYLMGGEAIQDSLYQERLGFLSSHYGITITHSNSLLEPSQRWPNKVQLASSIPGDFGSLPSAYIQAHFSLAPQQNHRIELQRGFKPPKPRMLIRNLQGEIQQASQTDPTWENISGDPTEAFRTAVQDTAPMPRRIVSETLDLCHGTVNLYDNGPAPAPFPFQWTPLQMQRLDLWGHESEDMEVDPEEVARDRKIQKRKRGYRSPPPEMNREI